jgi:hypothetical protein
MRADRVPQVVKTKKRANMHSFRSNIGIMLGIINQDADLMHNYFENGRVAHRPNLNTRARCLAGLLFKWPLREKCRVKVQAGLRRQAVIWTIAKI